MSSEEGTTSRVQAVAWDPRSPATLMIPSVVNNGKKNDNVMEKEKGNDDNAFQMNTFMSHDGVGCNSHETSALLHLLDAREAYLQSDVGEAAAIRSASHAYRKALATCVQDWEDALNSNQQQQQNEDDMDDDVEKEAENLDLLKIAYAVTHLSETFLLTLLDDSVRGEHHYFENTSSLPGAATADTVRYLRLHHMEDPEAIIDDDTLDRLQQSVQPEQLDGGDAFWNLLENYVRRGCLEDAWALFSRHSLRRRSMEALSFEPLDEYQTAALAQDREGFRALEAILLSAPLPGGRTDAYDADVDMHDDQNSQVEEDELLDGIPRTAYKLWESNNVNRESGDFPIHFQWQAAMHSFQSWQRAVKDLPEVKNLKRRIPQLQRILNIMTGNFSDVEFESWAEELCAELLYKLPNVRLEDIHVRASKTMEKYETTGPSGLDDVILSVMRGNAGSVVEIMHELGGGSGAALPAVMTSLLYDLLDDAHVMPETDTEYSLQTELLLGAAFALRASLATEGQHDLATRLTVRLLLPHIRTDSDVRITATLADTLSHYLPQTDAEAKALIALCHGLVERKNIRVADGCVSIALARYRHFLAEQRPGGAVYWLMQGMELESWGLCDGPSRTGAWQTALSNGVCYRLLVAYCQETADDLLKGILGDGKGTALLYARGKEMSAALEEDDLAPFIPAVKVLNHVLIMAGAVAERKDDSLVASSIIACLEERPDDEDNGVVSCLARIPMHWNLIRLAKVILDRNSEREAVEAMHLFTASFDVRGMQVLLERFTSIVATTEMEGGKIASDDVIYQTRLALAEGLMRAFVAENATKQIPTSTMSRKSVAGVYSANLSKVSREQQEMVVQNMLEF